MLVNADSTACSSEHAYGAQLILKGTSHHLLPYCHGHAATKLLRWICSSPYSLVAAIHRLAWSLAWALARAFACRYSMRKGPTGSALWIGPFIFVVVVTAGSAQRDERSRHQQCNLSRFPTQSNSTFGIMTSDSLRWFVGWLVEPLN